MANAVEFFFHVLPGDVAPHSDEIERIALT